MAERNFRIIVSIDGDDDAPHAVGFAVMNGKEQIGELSYDQVRKALIEFDQLNEPSS